MQPGWYILNYHNIDWEDSLLTRAVGGTVRPDVFAQHLEWLREAGELISVSAGLQRLAAGEEFRRPAFSVWFDDGFRGTREYGLPICERFGITAAVSVNSRFALRREMFWRCQVSYLVLTDGARHLRRELRGHFERVPLTLREWTTENFGPTLRRVIDEVYEQRTTPAFREDARRLFDDVDGIRRLADAGWLITNHTASHPAITLQMGWSKVAAEFEECDELVRECGPGAQYWVIPFGNGAEHFLPQFQQRATAVLLGKRRNTVESWQHGLIWRHSVPTHRGQMKPGVVR